MKDYRYFGRYTRDQWEDDTEWKARRLQFIFDVSHYMSDDYKELELYKEKNEFYRINDNEVGRLAAKYNCYGEGDLERFSMLSGEECVKHYIKLILMKRSNKKEFVKKCNINLYCYVSEQRYDEMQDVLKNNEDLRYEYDELFE